MFSLDTQKSHMIPAHFGPRQFGRNGKVDWLAGRGYNYLKVSASAVYKGEDDHLTGEQNPTQFHIVNALADLPVLAQLPATKIKCSANLSVADKKSRVLT